MYQGFQNLCFTISFKVSNSSVFTKFLIKRKSVAIFKNAVRIAKIVTRIHTKETFKKTFLINCTKLQIMKINKFFEKYYWSEKMGLYPILI